MLTLVLVLLVCLNAFSILVALLYGLSLRSLYKKVVLLLDYVAELHGIFNQYGFTCKYMRSLAVSTGWRRKLDAR